jgi:hypothetical protein
VDTIRGTELGTCSNSSSFLDRRTPSAHQNLARSIKGRALYNPGQERVKKLAKDDIAKRLSMGRLRRATRPARPLPRLTANPGTDETYPNSSWPVAHIAGTCRRGWVRIENEATGAPPSRAFETWASRTMAPEDFSRLRRGLKGDLLKSQDEKL